MKNLQDVSHHTALQLCHLFALTSDMTLGLQVGAGTRLDESMSRGRASVVAAGPAPHGAPGGGNQTQGLLGSFHLTGTATLPTGLRKVAFVSAHGDLSHF